MDTENPIRITFCPESTASQTGTSSRRSTDTEDPIRIRHVTPGLVNNAVSSNLQSPAHPNRLVPPSDRGGIASIPDGDTPVPRSRAGCCAIECPFRSIPEGECQMTRAH